MRTYVMCALLCAASAISFAADSGDAFEMRIRPVLAKNCLSCHSDAKMGGLQLDSREHLLKGGKSGAAIVPGDPDKSLLVQAIRYSSTRKMPPTGKLKDDEIESLEAWVKAGADLAGHREDRRPESRGVRDQPRTAQFLGVSPHCRTRRFPKFTTGNG